jgi:hypothetical protein
VDERFRDPSVGTDAIARLLAMMPAICEEYSWKARFMRE